MRNHFFVRKLHSLLGIIPIGLFLLEHMFTNSFALQGPEAFNKAVNTLQSIPYLPVFEIVFILLPILFHAVYGIWVTYLSHNNGFSYRYVHNWFFYLQRATAVIILVFLTWHIWVLRLSGIFTGTKVSFATMDALLSNNFILALYVIGLLAAVFHFSNGIWAFLISWGLTIGEKSQKVSFYFAGIAFIIIGLVGLNSLFAFVR
ncbi:succinate dehydrogenase cytochrome B558 [Paradesulfitobacterium aromaticivorans]